MSEQQYKADVKPGFKKPMDEPISGNKGTAPATSNTTTQPVTPAQPMRQQMKPVEQAAGFGEALSSLLSTGGGLQANVRDNKAGTYKSGAIKGMTEDEAVEYGKQQWEKAPKEIREKYASRVQNRPADSERMAAFNQMDQAAQAAENVNNLPGADEDLVVNPESGARITNRTKENTSMNSTGTQSTQWKKPMDKPTKGAGYGSPISK